jgi:hypothetical protein
MKNDCKKYVDNDVFKFRCAMKWDLLDYDITVYTKPFPDDAKDTDEQVMEKYFTKEKIDELKQMFIQIIQECENPLDIVCVDWDGGYEVTEDMLFDVEK